MVPIGMSPMGTPLIGPMVHTACLTLPGSQTASNPSQSVSQYFGPPSSHESNCARPLVQRSHHHGYSVIDGHCEEVNKDTSHVGEPNGQVSLLFPEEGTYELMVNPRICITNHNRDFWQTVGTVGTWPLAVQ